jgi:hypothetical protein
MALTVLETTDTCHNTVYPLGLEAQHVMAWTLEVFLQDSARQNSTSEHEPAAADAGMNTASSFRTQMLWRLLEINSEILRAFLRFRGDEIAFLNFASFSQLFYVLISQARVSFVLLNVLASHSPAHYTNPDGREEERQCLTPREIIDYIGYDAICGSLLLKLEGVALSVHGVDDDKLEILQEVRGFLKTMKDGYARKLQNRLEISSGLTTLQKADNRETRREHLDNSAEDDIAVTVCKRIRKPPVRATRSEFRPAGQTTTAEGQASGISEEMFDYILRNFKWPPAPRARFGWSQT